MSDSQKWLILAAIVGLGWLIYALSATLTPFLVSALLAYLGDPLVDKLETYKLKRSQAVIVVFSLLMLVLVITLTLILPVFVRQIARLVELVPVAFNWLHDFAVAHLPDLPVIKQNLDLDKLREMALSHWQQVGGLLGSLVGTATYSGQVVVGWLVFLLMVPVITFYLLRDWDLLVESLRRLVPRRYERECVSLSRECHQVLASFVRGQLLVMLALGLIYSLGLSLVGLDLALVIGFLSGLLSFVPYLGFAVGLILAFGDSALQFKDLMHPAYVLAVYAVGQMLEGVVLSPWLMGRSIGMHPVAVIFAVLAGGELFGFFGVLLALPVAAVSTVLLRHSRDKYLASEVYSG